MTPSPSSELRVAVLGAGRWAAGAHLPGWKRDPRCRLVAVCDVEADRAEACAREFDIPTATTDWRSTVARTDVDVVDVVTPSHTRSEERRVGKECRSGWL